MTSEQDAARLWDALKRSRCGETHEVQEQAALDLLTIYNETRFPPINKRAAEELDRLGVLSFLNDIRRPVNRRPEWLM
jgi:hypothetical protein